MDYECKDKAYLSSYSLDTRLFDHFNFTVADAAPIRSVFLLSTDQGYKILKKIHYDTEEIKFLYNSLKKIKEGYPYIINFKETITGEPYVNYKDGTYVVFDIVDGRECMFENQLDIKEAALGLSYYHRAAEGIKINHKTRNMSGKLPLKYRQCIKDMENYKKIAKMHVNKNEFDSIYLDYCEYYINYSKKAITTLEASDYYEACNTKMVLCHHDLAHHNIMIGNDNRIYFLDFDYAVIDLPEHDLSNLITKTAKRNNWDYLTLDTIIDSYGSVTKINSSYRDILIGYLMFPIDFYDISKAYYTRTKMWEESDFIEKIKRKAGYKERREELIQYLSSKQLFV